MAPKNNPCGVSTLQKQKLLQPRPQGQAQPRTQGITFAHPHSRTQSPSYARSTERDKGLWPNPEEGGSSSQHALQLINIHNHDFSQC